MTTGEHCSVQLPISLLNLEKGLKKEMEMWGTVEKQPSLLGRQGSEPWRQM